MTKNKDDLNRLLFTSIAVTSPDFRKKLVELGADVNAVNEYSGESVLAFACYNYTSYNSNLKYLINPYVEFLLEHGANIFYKNPNNGRTVLFDIVSSGQIANLKLLVDKGADLFDVDDDGYTLLHEARGDSNENLIAEYLIDQGIDVNAKNQYGHTALQVNYNLQNISMVKKLESAGFDLRATCEAGSLIHHFVHSIETIKYLIEKGIDPMIKNNHGTTGIEAICEMQLERPEDKEFVISLLDKISI